MLPPSAGNRRSKKRVPHLRDRLGRKVMMTIGRSYFSGRLGGSVSQNPIRYWSYRSGSSS